jgi:DNA-binding response OmpR family regulator
MTQRVIIVDDEAIVAIDMEIALQREGYDVVGLAGTVKDAMALIASTDFNVAILDANLHGESAEPIAAALRARGRPFIWVTGYTSDQLDEWRGDAPVVSKPFSIRQLMAKLRSLAPGAGGSSS